MSAPVQHPASNSEARKRTERIAERLMADAWDEGFTRGFYDALAGGSRDASESAAENPYRSES